MNGARTVEAAPKATVICVDGDAVTNGEQHLVQAVDYKNYFNPEKPPVKSDADDMAYIYFTSGSTGQPKAIAGRLQGIGVAGRARDQRHPLCAIAVPLDRERSADVRATAGAETYLDVR